MGLFSFIKDAGKKIFGHKEDAPTATPEQIQEQQAASMRQYIASMGLNISNLDAKVENGVVTLTGEASTKADYEKTALLAGNIAGISSVDNQMTVAGADVAADTTEPDSDTYTVLSGDSLWKIAAHYYGDGNKYQSIVDANQPMIKDADEIYPGQLLRIPKLAAATS